MKLSKAIREVIPEGEFTWDDIADSLWRHPDFQDLEEPIFTERIRDTLRRMDNTGEINLVRYGNTGKSRVNVYERA